MKLMAAAGIVLLASLAACGGNGHEGHSMGAGGTFAFGEPGDPADADRTVEVATTENLKFDPASIEVAAGETITFIVTNDTTTPHEFVLGDEEYQDSHGDSMAGGDMGHEENGVTLEPGDRQELTWTFTEAGEVIYACHVAGHYASGMRGTVAVE